MFAKDYLKIRLSDWIKVKKETYIRYCNIIDHWCINGYNGVKSYQAFYPNASVETATSNFYKILRITEIQEYLSEKQNQLKNDHEITLESRIKDIKGMLDIYHEMMSLALEDNLDPLQEEKLKRFSKLFTGSTATSLSDQLNKIIGVYEKDNSQKQQTTILIDLVDDEAGQS